LGRENFDRKREGAFFRSLQRSDIHYLASHFLAAVVTDGDDHEILEWLLEGWVADHPFHPQRGRSRHLALRCFGIEAQVVHAARTDTEAFENRRLAVRTGARLAR
jgi:hypothetical protein